MEGKDDTFVKVKPLLKHINNWQHFIQEPVSGLKVENMKKHERTGRPLGSDRFIEQLEFETGKCLKKRKPGPKGRRKNNN